MSAPTAVARFREEHPTVTFDFHTLHYDEVARALYEHEVDMALAYNGIEHPRVANFQIGSGELMMLFRKGHFGDDLPARMDLAELQRHNYIGSGATGPVSDIFSAEVERRDLIINEPITVSTFYMAAALVRFGVGVAVVDEFTAKAEATAEMDYRPLDPPLRFGVYCMHLEDRPLSRLSRSFIKLMAEVLGEVVES